MEILNRPDDCHFTQNHPHLGLCLHFKYLVLFCCHIFVQPFWQNELLYRAEHFCHVFEVHCVFLPVTAEELPPPCVLTCLGWTGKTTACLSIFSSSDYDEREAKTGERSMAKVSLNVSPSSNGGSSTATERVMTVPLLLLFPWSGGTDILLLE